MFPSRLSKKVRRARPAYECCRFRGSVVALDAATGKVIWKSFAIASEPRPHEEVHCRDAALGAGRRGDLVVADRSM